MLVAALAVGLVGCGDRGATDPAATAGSAALPVFEGPPRIIASIHPLASLASQLIGRETGDVETLLPPGVSEHSSEILPDRLRALHESDVLLAVGMGLDPVAERAAAQKPELVVLRFADLVADQLPDARPVHDDGHGHVHDQGHAHDHGHSHHDHSHHTHDPAAPNAHLWLDPALTLAYIEALAQQLEALYPDHADTLRTNARTLTAEIRAIDEEYQPRLAAVPRKELVTFHNAFDLLAAHYGLEVVAHLIDVEVAAGEVTPGALAEAIEAVRTHDLKVVYAEPQFPDAAMAALQRQTGVAILRLDPLGEPGLEGRDTYQQLLRYNLDTLLDGQSR